MTDRTGKALADARLNGDKLEVHPGPTLTGQDQAYDVQADLIQELNLPIAGWKIGATNARAQTAVGSTEPFYGPMFERWIYAAPTRVPVPQGSIALIEAELGFHFASDVALTDGKADREQLSTAIGTIAPAIEIVDTRISGGLSIGVNWLIADGGANHAFIYGEEQTGWQVDDLDALDVSVTMEGTVMGTGLGKNAMDGQMNALCWLAEALHKRGTGLKAGDWVTTGVLAPFFSGERGVPIVADFGDLGRVEIALV